MKRRTFFNKMALTFLAVNAIPQTKSPKTSKEKTIFLTSLPMSLPFLGYPIVNTFNKLSEILPNLVPYRSNLNHWVLAHDDRMFFSDKVSENEIILSTIGFNMAKKDYRLALIENIPFTGKSGEEITDWLFNQGGLSYWQSVVNDWGMHVQPIILVNNTDFGWVNTEYNFVNYNQLRTKSRGTTRLFFDQVGAKNTSKYRSKIQYASKLKYKDLSMHFDFIQIINKKIDLIWKPIIGNFKSFTNQEKPSALLIGLYFSKKYWNTCLSIDQKLAVEKLCKETLIQTQKMTSHSFQKRLNKKNNTFIELEFMKKDFLDFLHDDLFSQVGSHDKLLNKLI